MRAFAQAMLPPLMRIAEIVTAALIFIMMMLTFADVVGRYIFTAPIFGAAEMIQFLLAMTIFGGLCLVNARDEHITVELFETQLDRLIPPAVRRVIIQLFSVGMMAIIAYQLYQFALEVRARRQQDRRAGMAVCRRGLHRRRPVGRQPRDADPRADAAERADAPSGRPRGRPVTPALIGFAVLILLCFFGFRVGFATMFVGLVGFAYLRGWGRRSRWSGSRSWTTP